MLTVALTKSHARKEVKESNMFLSFEKNNEEIGSIVCYVPFHSVKSINEIDEVSCYIELVDGEILECESAAEDIVRNLEEMMNPYSFLSSS